MNNNYRMIVKSASYYARNHLTPDAYQTIPCTAIIDTGIFPHHDLDLPLTMTMVTEHILQA